MLLHSSLKRRAKDEGISLNGLCLLALKSFLETGMQEAHEGAPVSLRQIQELLGDSLSGPLLFGSVARGERRESSDIDLMIVVSADLPLTRALYERWDRGIDAEGTSRLSPHFVHLPEDQEEAGSLWCEAAMDGVVLFDPEGRTSRFLRAIRRSMAEGRL